MTIITSGRCWRCREPFTEQNVFTPAGERELYISGTCEACFDEIMDSGEEVFGSVELPKGGC